MVYTESGMGLVQCSMYTTPTSNTTISLSNISDISPLRGGSGQEANTILITYPNTSTLLTNCSGVISFQSNHPTSSTLISNCQSVLHRDPNTSMVSGNLTVSNSTVQAITTSNKTLFNSNSIVDLGTGTKVLDFTAMGQNQPLRLSVTGANFKNSPVPIAVGETNITSTKHVHTISGSPITFGTSFAGGYRTTISGVNIDMVDSAQNPIGRLGASSPFSYIINGVHWSGGLPDVTNFNPAQGIESGNRKAS